MASKCLTLAVAAMKASPICSPWLEVSDSIRSVGLSVMALVMSSSLAGLPEFLCLRLRVELADAAEPTLHIRGSRVNCAP